MTRTILSATLCALMGMPAHAFEITTPDAQVNGAEVHVSDPDAGVTTLGDIDIFIDLAAAHDDLLALKVRRSGLTLPDGRTFTAFGVHKDSGLIVLAAGDVTHVSITGVQDGSAGGEASVLFHGGNGKVIAPKPGDIAAFDRNLQPIAIHYTPLTPPGEMSVPVTIMLDSSGSMDGYMETVSAATQDFLRLLPGFATCAVTAFNSALQPVTPSGVLLPCNGAIRSLDNPIKAEGPTALFQAIEEGFEQGFQATRSGGLNITVVVTDGINTVPYGGTLATLEARKAETGSKLFVFWAGNYEPGYLGTLADLEIVSTGDLPRALERFFRALGISISGMQRLRLDQPLGNAAPVP